jgi:hypothetical protein
MRNEKSRTAEVEEPVQADTLGYDLWSYNAFVRQVEFALEGQHLGYTRRLRLIKAAANLGVRRFDANLIIALVQHRAKPVAAAVQTEPKPSWKFPLANVACFVIVQSAIILAAWWMTS